MHECTRVRTHAGKQASTRVRMLACMATCGTHAASGQACKQAHMQEGEKIEGGNREKWAWAGWLAGRLAGGSAGGRGSEVVRERNLHDPWAHWVNDAHMHARTLRPARRRQGRRGRGHHCIRHACAVCHRTGRTPFTPTTITTHPPFPIPYVRASALPRVPNRSATVTPATTHVCVPA